jgi:hypothetical protein
VAAGLQPRGPALGVAPGKGAEPVDRVARDRGDWRGGQALRQQPDDRPMAARPGIVGPAIVCCQCITTEMGVDRKSCWHVIMIHEDLV